MAQDIDLIAEFREDTGKGSSRRLRHAGKVPAIIYGAGREPRKLTFNHNELLKATDEEAFFSSILQVKVGENVRSAILKDIQVHPAKRLIMHMDLQRVVDDEEIRMDVPLHYLNEESAPGVKTQGGQLSKMVTEVEIECLPRYLPEFIAVDVGEMNLDDMLHYSDIKLPEGVSLTNLTSEPPHDEAIASVHVMRVAEEEPEETDEDQPEAGEVPTAKDEAEEDDSEDSKD